MLAGHKYAVTTIHNGSLYIRVRVIWGHHPHAKESPYAQVLNTA